MLLTPVRQRHSVTFYMPLHTEEALHTGEAGTTLTTIHERAALLGQAQTAGGSTRVLLPGEKLVASTKGRVVAGTTKHPVLTVDLLGSHSNAVATVPLLMVAHTVAHMAHMVTENTGALITR